MHDKPKRTKTTERWQTMEILRRYCMGGGRVGFQIVSDQRDCLRSVVTGRANYEDEFYSVSPMYARSCSLTFEHPPPPSFRLDDPIALTRLSSAPGRT